MPLETDKDAHPTEPDEINRLEAENKSLRDRLLRALADAENTRRRAQDRIEDARQFSIADFAREVLIVIDNLQRAITVAENEETVPNQALLEGVKATQRLFVQTLERFGVRRIEALGHRFDPHLHEAVMTVDDGSQPPSTIVRVKAIRSTLETPRGWRIAKEKQAHKIDVVVALAMAALFAVREKKREICAGYTIGDGTGRVIKVDPVTWQPIDDQPRSRLRRGLDGKIYVHSDNTAWTDEELRPRRGHFARGLYLKGEKCKMPQQKLSDIQIAARIVPTHLRWPERGTSSAWIKAHDCVDALKDLIRDVDASCIEAEHIPDLSASAIARRRAELGNRTLSGLVNFRSFEIAEKAMTENIDALERLSDLGPEQARMHQKLMTALKDLRGGIEATKRMLVERCKMGESTFV